eukprot:m.291809 g.291809  ORF g.291809 m.291809 type:complete len:60 (+) comp19480_c0_seq2:3863-4042(+)
MRGRHGGQENEGLLNKKTQKPCLAEKTFLGPVMVIRNKGTSTLRFAFKARALEKAFVCC